MAWYDNVTRFLTQRFSTPPKQPQSQSSERTSLPGGRASIDTTSTFPSATWLIMPPTSYEQNWSLMTIDAKSMERISPLQLMEVLADLSPEVSRAHWDFLRLCNPGYEVYAYPLAGDNIDQELPAGKKAIDDFIAHMAGQERNGNTFEVILGRLLTGTFFRGAPCAELVLDERGRYPLDIATPDPASIRFRRRTDPVLGQVWQAGQWQYGSDFVPLDRPTFFYSPVDPMPGSPYGRPLAAPAMFSCMMLIGMMHDLKRVIQHQGYERLDISVNMTKILEAAPHLASDPAAFQRMEAQLVSEVSNAFGQLEPDDTYIHTDTVVLNKPVGVSQASLSGIESVINMLEHMAARALKTMPINFGLEAREGDLQANRSFELFNAGIKSIQHLVEEMLEGLFTLALQAQGIQARVEFRFAELRASEELRDRQSEQLGILNEAAKRDQGWQSQDEASENITGTPAVSPAPIAQSNLSAVAPGIGNVAGQPSVNNNATWVEEVRAARSEVQRALDAISPNGYH